MPCFDLTPSGGPLSTDALFWFNTQWGTSIHWCLVLIKISLKFVPMGLIVNKSALAQMAWRHTGDKPLWGPNSLMHCHISAVDKRSPSRQMRPIAWNPDLQFLILLVTYVTFWPYWPHLMTSQQLLTSLPDLSSNSLTSLIDLPESWSSWAQSVPRVYPQPRTNINSLSPGRFERNFRWVILKLISVIGSWGISCEIALRWISLDLR